MNDTPGWLKRTTLALGICLALTSCGSGKGDASASETGNPQSGTQSTPIDPLLGADANANHVRDDVDAYINSANLTPAQHDAVTRLAAGYQQILEAEKLERSDETYLFIALGIFSAQNCVLRSGANLDMHDRKLRRLTFNSEERIRAWITSEAKLNGATLDQPEDIQC
jgi:hypothetical protein